MSLDMVIAAQVLGEYLNVARRKMPDRLSNALDVVGTLTTMLPVIATTAQHIAPAGRISHRYGFQFWDALIINVYNSAQVELLLTEDLQDGQIIDGVEILNPFDPKNEGRVVEIIGAPITPAS